MDTRNIISNANCYGPWDVDMNSHVLLDQALLHDLLHPSFDPFQPLHDQFGGFQGDHVVDNIAGLGLGQREDLDEEEGEEEGEGREQGVEALGAMKEMMYRIAAMQPVDIDPSTIKKPKRRNVKISDDPQSVAARHRRERISERIRILQRLVPGGTKMDTASMLDEAIRYVKFLKRQVHELTVAAPPLPPLAEHAVGHRGVTAMADIYGSSSSSSTSSHPWRTSV